MSLLNNHPLRAQETHTLRGYIFSRQDTIPLGGTMAYIDGSTLSAITDNHGKIDIDSIPKGRRWLIVEKPGYKTLLLPVEFNYGLRNIDTLYLENKDETPPSPFSEKEMSVSLRKFSQRIFGQRNFKKITVNNPEAFRITEKSPLQSDVPFRLQLINNYLGYDISFRVRRFELAKERQVLSHYLEASTHFKRRQASSEKEQRKWEFNRQYVYNGSLRHFLKNLVDKSLEENGFECFVIEGNQNNDADKIRSGKRVRITAQNLTDYITYYPNKLRTMNRLKINRIIEVRYTRQTNAQGNPQVSYIVVP